MSGADLHYMVPDPFRFFEADTFTASTNVKTVQRYGYDGQNAWADLDASNNLETRTGATGSVLVTRHEV